MARAVKQIVKRDLVEEWVPDILRYRDQLDHVSDLGDEVNARLLAGAWDAASEVQIPKTPFFSRPAQTLTLRDRIAYQAIVGSFASKIDDALSSRVYSARLDHSANDYFTLRGTTQWQRFLDRVAVEASGADKWVIKSDLTAFFDCIRHDFLYRDLEAIGASPKSLESLAGAFYRWSPVDGQGLAQGPDASRVLANLYMAQVDDLMLQGGFQYFRYMDDVRIVADSKMEAVRAMRLFEGETRKRALIASPAKTKLLHGVAAVESDIDLDRRLGQYLFDSKNFRAAREFLVSMMHSSFLEEGHINVKHSKFALWRLALMREPGVLSAVLSGLDDLGPVASVLGAYLGAMIENDSTIAGLSAYFSQEGWSDVPFLYTHIFAAMLQLPGRLPVPWTDAARRIAVDKNSPGFSRRIATNVIAKSYLPGDMSLLRRLASGEDDADLVRSAVVGLARVGHLDSGTASRVSRRSRELSWTVEHLLKSENLPSLVFARSWVPMESFRS